MKYISIVFIFLLFILNMKDYDIIMCLNWTLKTNSSMPGEVKFWT